MRHPAFSDRSMGSDEGAALAAMAACGLVGALVASAVAIEDLLALLHPLLPYMH